MKVQLERTLPSCPPTLKCTACSSGFTVGRIRTLLCSDEGFIHGDLCPNCLKTGSKGIQQRLKNQALRTLQQDSYSSGAIATYQQGLVHLEMATTAIAMPKFYHWWLKQIEILAQETQELENARLGLSSCQCGRPKNKLRIVFQSDSPSNT